MESLWNKNTEEEEANGSRRNLRARTGVILHEPHYRTSDSRFHSYQRKRTGVINERHYRPSDPRFDSCQRERGLELYYMSHIIGPLTAGSIPTREEDWSYKWATLQALRPQVRLLPERERTGVILHEPHYRTSDRRFDSYQRKRTGVINERHYRPSDPRFDSC